MGEQSRTYFKLVNDIQVVISQHRSELQNLIEAAIRARRLAIVEDERQLHRPEFSPEDYDNGAIDAKQLR